ncbi:hypothetical protein [Viridibacillus arvi]|uniref:Uncharacterized protein n=1 Tax=Viridibacillus arvi TaxID=263475 RepID=A0A0M0LG61_9BACL|nr:hypothetical protein [Viridibacillus arvi]KOO50029.1 hypothetical protein AMD00_17200 [Viridibacillus arvi]
MTNFGILSILFLLLIIFIVVLFIKSMSKHMRLNQRPLKIFIAFYTTVLIIAPIIYLVLPKTEVTILTDKMQKKLSLENQMLYNALFENKTAEFDEKFLVNEWSREIKEKEIFLKMMNPEEGSQVGIIVQQSDALSNQITGKLYRKNYFVEEIHLRNFDSVNINIVDTLNEPIITWEDATTLVVKNPPNKKLSFVSVSDATDIIAFNNEDSRKNESTVVKIKEWEYAGPYYLLITVPKNIKVWSDEGLRIYK